MRLWSEPVPGDVRDVRYVPPVPPAAGFGISELLRRRLHRFLGFTAGRFDGADEDMGIAAFEARLAFHAAIRCKVGCEAHEEFLAEIGVSDFASAELHHGLDLPPGSGWRGSS